MSGARWVLTQPLAAISVLTLLTAGITIPIMPGIMPIQNYLSFRRMTNLCGTHIPPHILSDLERIQVRFGMFDAQSRSRELTAPPLTARRRGGQDLWCRPCRQHDAPAL